MTLRVGSLFSGVGGFDLGLERAGMTTVFQVEWDEKCQSVLRRHWPDVPKFKDIRDVSGTDLPDCDLIAFGSPCQDLSVGGKRAGFNGTRSSLFHEAIRICKEYQADGSRSDDAQLRYVLWENVLGSLSTNAGYDFAAVLDSLGELRDVESIEWRVLDAQFFSVPQRRRRIYVIARIGTRSGGTGPVLPFGDSVRRNPQKVGNAIPQTARGAASCAEGRGGSQRRITGTVTTTWAKGPGNTQVEEGLCIAVTEPQLAVRRLTPREVERLQGWDDDWTRWDDIGNEVADTARYRMIGNGVRAPVATYIGRFVVADSQIARVA